MRLHASSVSIDGRGVLILGASGSGKSALSLQLMAHGAQLISDDQTLVQDIDGQPVASAPQSIRGSIEARGVGLLVAHPAEPTPIILAIDMDTIEDTRLPPDRTYPLPGRNVPLLHKLERSYFAAAILQYIKAGKAQH